MNWQKLGPMIHTAAKQYLQDPNKQNELELLLCIQAGDPAGNRTEWDSRAEPKCPVDEFGFTGGEPAGMRDA